MQKRIRFWLTILFRCRHGDFEYECCGGKGCVYNDEFCECGCSVPVYEVSCPHCGMTWTLGEDELIGFFAKQKKGDEKNVRKQ